MSKIALAAVAVFLTASTAPARAHDMSAMGAMSSAPNAMGAHMHMDEHMKMTELRPQTPQDVARADALLAKLRQALLPYRDAQAALSEGFSIFLPTVPQDVYHFTDYRAAGDEYHGASIRASGSLLYVRNSMAITCWWAMYSAPGYYTPDQLDQMIPLSVARWHQHVNICLPKGITLTSLLQGKFGAGRTDLPGTLPVAANPEALDLDQRVGFMADGRFGFEGKIHDPETCESAGGSFLPLAFGWMVHVYPFNGEDLKVSYGMEVPKPPTSF